MEAALPSVQGDGISLIRQSALHPAPLALSIVLGFPILFKLNPISLHAYCMNVKYK